MKTHNPFLDANDRVKNADDQSHLECPICKTSNVFGEEFLLSPSEVLEVLSCYNDHYWEEIWIKKSVKIKKPEDYSIKVRKNKVCLK